MDKLKPCPFCKQIKIYNDIRPCAPKFGILYVNWIGCVNLDCSHFELTAGYGLTKKAAMRRAIRKWNRRAEGSGT